MTGLLGELQRRNVFRVAIFYIVSAWLFLQIADLLFEVLLVPDWTLRFLFGALAVAFPFVLFFAWAYELTPEGLKREEDVDRSESITPQTGRKLDAAVIVLLILGAVVTMKGRDPESGDDVQAPVETPVVAQSEVAPPPSAAVVIDDRTIAVLPFVNMSSDPEQEFFSDGMTEEILNVLAKIEGLKVSGRTSSFQFKGQNLDLRDIGRRLGVAHVLEGSVRRSGDNLRITAQLVQSDDGFHLWSETYDRKLANVFAIQDEIARSIAEALKLPLGLAVDEQPAAARTEDMMAYEIYLRGLMELKRRSDGVQNAIDMMTTVVERDPGFAPAWAILALAHAVSPYYVNSNGRAPIQVWLTAAARAEAAAKRALALDPEAVMAQVALGNAAWMRRDWIAGDKAFKRAIEIDPRSADAYQQYAEFLFQTGHYEDSLELARKAVALDPLTPIVQNVLGYVLVANDMPNEAVRALNFARGQSMLSFVRNNLIQAGVEFRRPDILQGLLHGDPGLTDEDRAGLKTVIAAMADDGLMPEAQAWVRASRRYHLAAYLGIPEYWFEGQQSAEDFGVGGGSGNIFAQGIHPVILADPRTWTLIEEVGLREFWDYYGWPSFCRRTAPDAFTCGDPQ